MRAAKKCICALLLGLTLFSLSPSYALAADKIDTSKKGTMTIEYKYSGTALPGVAFDVYYMAEVDADGNYIFTEDFSGYSISMAGLTAKEQNELAETLKENVTEDNVKPLTTVTTGTNGKVKLSGLKTGLYLVVGETKKIDGYTYTPRASVVSIPGADSDTGSWNYDITVIPKVFRENTVDKNETITRKVLKVWEDTGYTMYRPSSVEVELLRDGEVYDTVTLSADNIWHYTWEELPKYNDDETEIDWTVSEKTQLIFYTTKIEQSGVTFVVRNTILDPHQLKLKTSPSPTPTPTATPVYTGTPVYTATPVYTYTTTTTTTTSPKLPQTGQLWWPVPLLVCLGLACVVAGSIRRRRDK